MAATRVYPIHMHGSLHVTGCMPTNKMFRFKERIEMDDPPQISILQPITVNFQKPALLKNGTIWQESD